MTRPLPLFAAALAVLIPFADLAEAQRDRTRGVTVLRIGPIEFRAGSRAFIRSDRHRRAIIARRLAPAFPYAEFDAEPFPFVEDDGSYWQLPQRDRARARQLDEDLGQALEELRRNLGQQGSMPVFPDTFDAPQDGAVEVTRLPAPLVQTPNPRAIIEEAEVLGRVPLTGEAAKTPATPVPVTEVGRASAADVATYGVTAFAPLSNPASVGLPEGQRYYVLNGKVVTLDAEAERALTVAALEAALR